MISKKFWLVLIFIACKTLSAQYDQLERGVQWNIEKNALILNYSSQDEIGKRYWDYLSGLLPKEPLEKYISSLRLFTDGEQEDLGGMSSLNEQNTSWEVDIDTVDFNLDSKDSVFILDYVHTAIHEFGHVITLNNEQVMTTEDEYQDDSIGYLTSEGYAVAGSYLGDFVKEFWYGELLNKWDKIDKIRIEAIKLNKLFKFYLDFENQFMTDYAAESPEEDIAESWTFFVLCDRPTADKIKYKKVSFFYQYPDLVKYREQIRSNLTSVPNNYLGNNKWVLED